MLFIILSNRKKLTSALWIPAPTTIPSYGLSLKFLFKTSIAVSPRSVQHKSASYPSSINLLIEPLIPASTFSAVKPVAANSGIEKSMNVGSIPTTQSVRIRQCLFFILGCFFERDVTHPEFSVQQALQVSPKTPASRGNTFQPVSRSEYLPEGY